jgi:hypothetical protein
MAALSEFYQADVADASGYYGCKLAALTLTSSGSDIM